VDSKKDIGRALADLGWELQADEDGPSAVMASYGKHHLMVNFEAGEPTSVIISYVGKGGGILSRKWPGIERLPTPQKVVQTLSQHL
jgi:hypothetical protein